MKLLFGILAIVVLLFLYTTYVKRVERFVDTTTTTDASGNTVVMDASGNPVTVSNNSLINLTLSDLMALVSSAKTPAIDAKAAYTQIQPTLLTDMTTAVRTGLQGSSLTSTADASATTSATPSTDQGCELQDAKRAFLKDYIRKDSVPCYGCSLP